MLGDKGVTENVKEANYFIVVKKYPSKFESLDYKMSAPIQKVRTYSDSTLTILEGNYYEYDKEGHITISGYYFGNKKEKNWYYYNDTAKVIREEKYKDDILINTIDPDTVKKQKPDSTLKKDEKEASFKNSPKDWIKYLMQNVKPDVAIQSVKSGQVRVGFTVNKEGKCVDVYLRKSVEFVLDEEAKRVIENSPLWQPAFQNGKVVNSYRVQPLTFSIQ